MREMDSMHLHVQNCQFIALDNFARTCLLNVIARAASSLPPLDRRTRRQTETKRNGNEPSTPIMHLKEDLSTHPPYFLNTPRHVSRMKCTV